MSDPRTFLMLAVGILLLVNGILDLNRRRAATQTVEGERDGGDEPL